MRLEQSEQSLEEHLSQTAPPQHKDGKFRDLDIKKQLLPVFVLDLVLKNNQTKRAMGTKRKIKQKSKLSHIFKTSWEYF